MRLVMKWASRGSLPFMKMLYPRKMDEVLWHSATCRLSKSIFVKIPRLPTIRVIGSQFISTSFLAPVGVPFVVDVTVPMISAPFLLVRPGSIPSGQFRASVPPFRFLVYGLVGKRPQRSDRLAVHRDACGRDLRARWLIHERHELVREAWHRAPDADSADVGAAAE